MKTALQGRTVAVATIACAICGSGALGQNDKDRVAMEWKRDPKVVGSRPDAGAPAPPDLPSDLAIAPAAAAQRDEASRLRRPGGAGHDVVDLAMQAAEEVALEAAHEWGWRQYWRAGFARGVHAAIGNDRLGAWDYQEGLRFGRLDPRARVLGDRIANDAAVERASVEAEARVREQFLVLESAPRRDRAGPRGTSPRGTLPASEGPWAIAPIFDDMFGAYPLTSAPGLSREGRRAVEDWRIEPAALARNDRAAGAYDAQWKDPAFAFSVWRDRQGPRSYWSPFTRAQREQFRAVFYDRFQETLGAIDMGPTYSGWRIGFADGWRYGAAVQGEWAYRQGYAKGFDLGVSETAAIAFPYAYERAYSDAYDASFEAWSRTARPEIAGVRLADDNDDGVFEPGERVFVEASVVNYGGAAGSLVLTASGDALDEPATTNVRLPARGPAPAGPALALRLKDRIPSRTRTAVTVAIGDARAESPLYVSRPFVIEGEPTIETDRLAGRVTITMAVSNTSRRESSAVVRIEQFSGPRDSREDDLGVVLAGRSREAAVTFENIPPLDLIRGETRWRASVSRGGKIDDSREIYADPVVTDLSNRDLVDFMLGLARTPRANRADVREARSLMIERLRADWSRAAESSGNPYKRDFESAGAETELGAIIRATKSGRRSFASPEVFAGLDGEIASLVSDLPGAHPLLRKWMKKLAKRLG